MLDFLFLKALSSDFLGLLDFFNFFCSTSTTSVALTDFLFLCVPKEDHSVEFSFESSVTDF